MALPDKNRLLARVKPYREKWSGGTRPEVLETPGPDQESVWDYPRPPEVREVNEQLRVVFAGATIADTTHGLRIIETAGAPVYYFPPESVKMGYLKQLGYVTICEWKGAGIHYDLVAGDRRSSKAAFSYPDPLDDLGQGFSQVAGWFAFYPARVDACYVGSEQVKAQPGGYYAGWVTAGISGPIKGAPGTENW